MVGEFKLATMNCVSEIRALNREDGCHLLMMMMLRRFVEHVLNSPKSQSNRWVLRRRANARGESVAVQLHPVKHLLKQ